MNVDAAPLRTAEILNSFFDKQKYRPQSFFTAVFRIMAFATPSILP
jgi:hypothetical protein